MQEMKPNKQEDGPIKNAPFSWERGAIDLCACGAELWLGVVNDAQI